LVELFLAFCKLQVYSKKQSLEKKYKMQYFNRLNWSAFVLTLICFYPKLGFSQSEVRQINGVKFDSLSSIYVKLDPIIIWNSNEIEMKPIKVKFKNHKFNFFLKVVSDGAILCFSDSLLQKPILLEKRNLFPFEKLQSSLSYSIQISKQNSFDGFIGFSLFCLEKKKILDESFFCIPLDDAVFDNTDSIKE